MNAEAPEVGCDEGYGHVTPCAEDKRADRGYGGDAKAGFYGDCDGEIAFTYRWKGPGNPMVDAGDSERTTPCSRSRGTSS